jgi:guanylate kinase
MDYKGKNKENIEDIVKRIVAAEEEIDDWEEIEELIARGHVG